MNKASIYIILLALMAACSDKTEHTKSPSQIIAKINNDELSIHQLNYQLSAMKIASQDLEGAKKIALRSLVDESLLFQKAMEEKMDRDPNILMTIEQSKRNILAHAWIDKEVKQVLKPTSYEVEDYYKNHPELFSNRRIYQIKEAVVSEKDDKTHSLSQSISSIKSFNQVLEKLDQMKVSYKVNDFNRPAENIPLDKLSEISKLNAGEFVINFDGQNNLHMSSLVSFAQSPVAMDKARPFIESFLLNQARKDFVDKQISKLRKVAKVEYLGEFAGMSSDVSAQTVSVPEAPRVE